MTFTPQQKGPVVSLCEQGSKVMLARSLAGTNGLPVRTGVEGIWSSSARSASRSPCANRGRRTGSIAGATRLQVSLCEQGSKLPDGLLRRAPHGLPVRTGVEGKPRFSSFLACRVSLCEQGSKVHHGLLRVCDTGLPVRTGVEGSLPPGLPGCVRSPCANRGRRVIHQACDVAAAVSLCERGSKASLLMTESPWTGLPVRTGVEGQARNITPKARGLPGTPHKAE